MTGPTLQLREVIDLTNSSPFSSAGTKYSGLDFWEACYRHDRVFFVVNHQFHGPGLRQTLGRAKETVAETSQGRVTIKTHLLFKNIFATSFFSNPNTQTLRISYLVTCCSVKTIVIKKRLRKTQLCCDFLSTPCHDCRITTALHQRLNPLNPNSSMLILHTVLYIFLKVLKGRICLPIENFFRWWSFPLFSWPQCLIQTDIVWRN